MEWPSGSSIVTRRDVVAAAGEYNDAPVQPSQPVNAAASFYLTYEKREL
jgi:hypothetical protein